MGVVVGAMALVRGVVFSRGIPRTCLAFFSVNESLMRNSLSSLT
jgi:hypothetical protein